MNPWQQQGVSILPDNLKDLLPLVGQKSLFEELQRFKKSCLSESSGERLTGFFVLHGGWGVGKSRVGHEICLEAVSEQVDWIVDTKPQRILESGLADGILPLFIRYIHVTNGPLGDQLNAENWIPMVAAEALGALLKFERAKDGGSLKRNQSRLIQFTLQALKPKGWDKHKTDLSTALDNADLDKAVRDAMVVLGSLGIKSLWIIVDEIEDITDVERDGLQSDERNPIKQELLTVIPRVIKAEDNRMQYPGINFVLLCSLAVGDLLKQVRAIERRTQRHELRTNAFTDVEAFFDYLRDHRSTVWQSIQDYPSGLKEAAFFAANRNFGWFNVIMHDVHSNMLGDNLPVYELIRRFATTGQGKTVVFDSDRIGEFNLEQDADKPLIEEFMYGLLPKAIGGPIDEGKARRLLEKTDASGKRLFTCVLEISPPEAHRITSQFTRSGFENEREAIMVRPGESRFDLRLIMESLRAYSTIALPPERRDHLLVCETLAEFTAQMKSLSPYAEQADHFAPILHGLLTDASYRLKTNEHAATYVGPSFQFLSRFHRLNRLRVAEEGFLTDSKKNTQLQEVYQKLTKDRDRNARKLLAGIANVIEQDEAPVAPEEIAGCKLPAIGFKSTLENFNLGPDGQMVLVHGVRASTEDIEQTLNHLASKRPAEPVMLFLQDEEERAVDLREQLARFSPKMAPRVVIVSLTSYFAETLIRFGLLGDAFFTSDMKTSYFNAGLARSRDVLKDAMRNWRQDVLDLQGLILSPLFYGSKVSDDQIEIFARGYAAMTSGSTYQDVCQTGTGPFSEKERDEFRKLVDRQVDPNIPFKKDQGSVPQLRLITKPGAEEVAEVPRALVALIRRCSGGGVALGSLEKEFFFEFPAIAGLTFKRADIIRHSIHFLKCLGLVEQDQNIIRLVSKPALEKQIAGAQYWLENRFEQVANRIRAIHLEEGENLVDLRVKEAKHWLKDAQNRLQDLALDFICKSWKELNRSNGNLPVYEERLKIALGVINQVTVVLARVYDPERERAFSYGPEAIQDLQHSQASPNFPLWKRLKILEGFYKEVEDRRKELLKRIQDVRRDVDLHVPDLSDGKKSLPTQAITMPLDLFYRELNFAADHPNRTITVGGSTLGIKSLGFKLHARNYVEARGRLGEIEAELNQPGRIVSQFLACMELWKSIRDEAGKVQVQVAKAEAFYVDAPEPIKRKTGLRVLAGDLAELHDALSEGGIRQGVDEADAAGAQATELVKVLEQDLNKLSSRPSQISEKALDLMRQVLPALTESYQQNNQDLIRAVSSIRRVQGKEIPVWPQQEGETYLATEAKFKALVGEMRADGEGFFKGLSGTRFDDYVHLVKAQAEGHPIDWQDDAHNLHVRNLQSKKLLELRLV
jgi:hypothetical protein